jgi:hypothetical protein
MPWFRKKDDKDKTPVKTKLVGKKQPTPKRKVAEAENLRPLIVKDRKVARKKSRETYNKQRDDEYLALKTGDINKMPLKDRGEYKLFVRNFVDSHFKLGELFLPFAVVMLVIMFTPLMQTNSIVSIVAILGVYGFFLVCIVEALLNWHLLKRQFKEFYGPDFNYKKQGFFTYMAMRILQFRRIRLPKPLPKAQIQKLMEKKK